MSSMVRFENRQEVIDRFRRSQSTANYADTFGTMFADRLGYKRKLGVDGVVTLLLVTIVDYAKKEQYTGAEYRGLLKDVGDILAVLFEGENLNRAILALMGIAESLE